MAENETIEDIRASIRVRLTEVEARFKFVPPGDDLRTICADRIDVCFEALAAGLPIPTIERLSGLSRQTLYRMNPATGEIRWVR